MTVVLVSLLGAAKCHNEKKCVEFCLVRTCRQLQESLALVFKSACLILEALAIYVLHQSIK